MSVAPESSLDARLRQLADVEDLKQLKARYCRFVDTERWEDFRALFTDDARFDLGPLGTFDGADAFVAGILERRVGWDVRTVHHCHLPELTLTSADTAHGIWAMCDLVDRVSTVDGSRRSFQGYGHYEEEYRREAGGWRIGFLRLTRLRLDEVAHDRRAAFPEEPSPSARAAPA
jgi:hypothetical protein